MTSKLCQSLLADAEKAGSQRDRSLCVAAANRITELENALRPFAAAYLTLYRGEVLGFITDSFTTDDLRIASELLGGSK